MRLRRWRQLAALTVLTIYFYFFMEWLFTVTRPSFMDLMPFGVKLAVLALPGLLVAGVGLLAVLILCAASRLFRRGESLLLGLGSLIPAGVLAATALMLVDDFTYTIFKFGVVSTRGAGRGVYALLFLLFLGGVWAWVMHQLRAPGTDSHERWLAGTAVGLLLVSLPLGGSLYLTGRTAGGESLQINPTQRPNILLIGSDGLDASATTLYGPPTSGQADTTPFLREFARQSLLAENNFPNANITAGSLVSIFTSKLPTQTRLMYPPDILRGADALEHLPGLLKSAGYYNAEISIDYYADPTVLNLQNSFVMVNGRSATVGRLYTLSRGFLPEDAAYFLSSAAKRLSERVLHIFYIQTMTNPYATVNQKLNTMSDQDRLDEVISLFRNIQQPLFIHVHLMGTHTNDDAIYAQGVVDFDNNMRTLMADLQSMGRLENTLVIVYTDHGYGDVSNERIPLLFHFPDGQYAGMITANTQNLDIAPTILDALGVPKPDWMEGVSLLKGEPPATRPIFSAAPGFRVDENDRLQLDLSKVKPPFYQFGTIGMVICQNWYALDTASLTWSAGVVRGYPTPCAPEILPDTLAAQQLLLGRLQADGFDVTTARQSLAGAHP